MKIVVLIATGLVMFGASAGVSWYLSQSRLATPDAQTNSGQGSHGATAQDHSGHTSSAGHEQSAPAATHDEHPSATEPTTHAAAPPVHGDSQAAEASHHMPVAIRPRPMSVEEIVKYSLGLKKREETLNEREQSLKQLEERQKLARADIQMDQQEFTSLLSAVGAQQTAATALMQKIEESRQVLAAEQKAVADRQAQAEAEKTTVDEAQTENIKDLATWMQAMDPAKAADVLKQFAQDNRLEVAVQILSHLEERDAAEILSALQDAKLISQFVEAYRQHKQPPKTPPRRR